MPGYIRKKAVAPEAKGALTLRKKVIMKVVETGVQKRQKTTPPIPKKLVMKRVYFVVKENTISLPVLPSVVKHDGLPPESRIFHLKFLSSGGRWFAKRKKLSAHVSFSEPANHPMQSSNTFLTLVCRAG